MKQKTQRIIKFKVLISLFLVVISQAFAQRQHGRNDPFMPPPGRPIPGMSMTYPRYLHPFLKISAGTHPGLGLVVTGIKDVNGDGYNDFVASTIQDTTFIFFGGPALDDKADAFCAGRRGRSCDGRFQRRRISGHHHRPT